MQLLLQQDTFASCDCSRLKLVQLDMCTVNKNLKEPVTTVIEIFPERSSYLLPKVQRQREGGGREGVESFIRHVKNLVSD